MNIFFVVVFIKYVLWIFSCILCVYCIRMLYRFCFVQHCAKFGNWFTLSGMSEFEILRTFLSIFFLSVLFLQYQNNPLVFFIHRYTEELNTEVLLSMCPETETCK